MKCCGVWVLGGGVFDGMRKERKLQIDEVAMDGLWCDAIQSTSRHFKTGEGQKCH